MDKNEWANASCNFCIVLMCRLFYMCMLFFFFFTRMVFFHNSSTLLSPVSFLVSGNNASIQRLQFRCHVGRQIDWLNNLHGWEIEVARRIIHEQITFFTFVMIITHAIDDAHDGRKKHLRHPSVLVAVIAMAFIRRWPYAKNASND